MNTLYKLLQQLKTANYLPYNANIPSIWNINNYSESLINQSQTVIFPNFIIDTIEQITKSKQNYSEAKFPTIYNLLVRLTTAFDHNQDGKITNEANKFKESGTLLKTILILPYLKKLGVDIIYFLPLTSIGEDGKKGNLGSPYSIKNPYLLDENLDEPLLNMTLEEQFNALIEAAHCLGMKVVCEFIFRTSSKDSELAIEHPNWFYWIKEEYCDSFHSPEFTKEELSKIKNQIEYNKFDSLPEPPVAYQKMYSLPPISVKYENGKIVGINDSGERVVIPGAFADWPPDDIQPAWTDVTFLKLFNNPAFNYMAYNTIRMYDNALIQPQWEATELWRHIENIIPYYQKEFQIDGVMIDMGHALPEKLLQRIIAKARLLNNDFLFWEENFVPNQHAVQQGFNLVLGYLPFDQHNIDKMKILIESIINNSFPIQFFATPETHNTPRAATRAGGTEFSKIAYTINKLLPLPTFIHSGFEIGETMPVNTGLGFDNVNTEKLLPEVLPLFSSANLNWLNNTNIVKFIIGINSKLEKYLPKENEVKLKLIADSLALDSSTILAFERSTNNENTKLIFIANYENKPAKIEFQMQNEIPVEYLWNENITTQMKDKITIEMKGFSFVLFSVKL